MIGQLNIKKSFEYFIRVHLLKKHNLTTDYDCVTSMKNNKWVILSIITVTPINLHRFLRSQINFNSLI